MADCQNTPPDTANTTETSEMGDTVVVSTLILGDITPPSGQAVHSGPQQEDFGEDGELLDTQSPAYDVVIGGAYPNSNMEVDQSGLVKTGKKESSVKVSTRPHHGAPGLGQSRGERGPAMERGRQNQAHQNAVDQYFQESTIIKRKLQVITGMMVKYSGEQRPLSLRKQTIQGNLNELKDLEKSILDMCQTPDVEEDYAVLMTSVAGMVGSFRELFPYAASDLNSTIWSSSKASSVHADTQAYKEMVGKKMILGEEKTEALTDIERQRIELRREQEALEGEQRTQARKAERLIAEQKERDQEELEEQQRQADESKRLEDNRRRQADLVAQQQRWQEEQEAEYFYKCEQDRIKREKANRDKAQRQMESELKEKIDVNVVEKAKVVRMKLDELENKKTEVSAHFDLQVQKAEQDMLVEIEQPSAPPPNLTRIDMVDVYQRGPGSLDNLKKAVLNDEEEKRSHASRKAAFRQGAGLANAKVSVEKGNMDAPMMKPLENSTPITSFEDPPSARKNSNMQATATDAQPAIGTKPRHNFGAATVENANVVHGRLNGVANQPVYTSRLQVHKSRLGAEEMEQENATQGQENTETPAAVQRAQQQVLREIENRMRMTTGQNRLREDGTFDSTHGRALYQREEEKDQLNFAAEYRRPGKFNLPAASGSTTFHIDTHEDQPFSLNPTARSFCPEFQRHQTPQVHGEASFYSADHIAATHLLASSIKQSRLPTQEPLTFEGDPLLYTAWKNTFSLIIEAQDISEVERLLYLQNYVKGPAKNAISGALASASPTAYSSAMATLDQRFGSPLVIATSYREKLESWPGVGLKDADSLQKIADFLNECLSATRRVGQTAIFEDVLYQKKILDKLPDWMRRKWQRNYSETRQNKNRYPTFSEFVKYVNDEATIANEPGWTESKGPTDSLRPNKRSNTYNTSKAQPKQSCGATAELTKRVEEIQKELSEMKTVQTATALQAVQAGQNTWMGPPMPGHPAASITQVPPQRTCAYCQSTTHHLCECGEIMKLPPTERRTVFLEKRLCFRCGSSSHFGNNCPRTRSCNICRGGHPTVLHGTFNSPQSAAKDYSGQQQQVRPQQNQGGYRQSNDARQASGLYPPRPRQKETRDPNQAAPKLATRGIQTVDVDQTYPMKVVDASVVQNSTYEASTQTVRVHYSCPVRTTMIVPVYVSSAEEPEKEILTYALLDTQAGVTFVAEELAKQLKTKGYSHPLRINTMTAKDKLTPSTAVLNLRVRAVDSKELLPLPVSYSTDILSVDPQTIPTPEIAMKYDHLKHLASQMKPYNPSCCAGLLIGYDNPIALMPTEVIQGSPYAIKTCLGWSVIGEQQVSQSIDGLITSTAMTTTDSPHTVISGAWDGNGLPHVVSNVFRTQTQEATTTDILNLMERDFIENESGHKSQEDTRFLEIMNSHIKKNDIGHYEMPLPFKGEDPLLPCNRPSAVIRLHSLRRQLSKDQKKKELYAESMAKLLEQGHAERVPEVEINNNIQWYIPHHGVVNEKKPDKIRVVFDCSAQYKGTALNDHLLQGPDLINPLIGVLLRFRKGKVAVSCDIRQMYYQFYVTEAHRDYFRFLWWEDGDLDKPPIDYRMKVHIFGATSSPGCANFGLKRLAQEHENEHPESAKFLKEDFYVDDGLHASEDVQTAAKVIKGAREICDKANMKLHKITSNSEELLSLFPQEDRAQTTCKDLGEDETSPVERILGLQWDTQKDVFTFPTSCKDKPLTKRGMLSTIASLYDPLGFIGPLILKGRVLLQQVCKEKGDWDDPLPESVREDWTRWQSELGHLDAVSIPRSFVPNSFGNIVKKELHHFSDASEGGYGQCSYLRLLDERGKIHCSLVMAKSRVTPLKTTTIPRLELQAATLSIRMAKFLEEQLHMEGLSHHYWTDSAIVLAYLANKSKRFHVFVANRVGEIMRDSDINQWAHVSTEKNPADIASRGATAIELDKSTWYKGPQFLWETEVVKESAMYSIPENDVEVNVKATTVSSSHPCDMDSRLQRSTSWKRLVKGMTMVFRKWTKTFRETNLTKLQLEEIVEKRLILAAQNEFLANPSPNLSSAMKQLNCKRDQDGVFVVRGRTKHPETVPILLPRESRITKLIVEQMHRKRGHPGRTTTIHHLREAGFWVIGFRRIVGSIIKSCTHCTRRYGKLMEQKMSDLPSERTSETLPFIRCGIDCFGPFITKEGRKELKRYGLLVTCLSTRAVHLEMLDNMTTDAFLNALRNVVAIRGEIKYIRSDRGTNFVGASRTLRKEWDSMSKEELQKRCMHEQQIEWVFNPPSASHTGGVWERLIRSARRILNGLLSEANTCFTPSTLRTLLYEVMAIMNSRPLSIESLEDPSGPLPLTPNHILTFKSTGILPPPGIFKREDLNLRNQWRKVQHLADRFWERWRTDYFTTLQTRRKWHHAKPNLAVNDVVLIKDENLCRSQWKMGRVLKVYFSDDGLVRRCRLLVANPAYQPQGPRKVAATTQLERHVHSLVLFVEGSETTPDVRTIEGAKTTATPVKEVVKERHETSNDTKQSAVKGLASQEAVKAKDKSPPQVSAVTNKTGQDRPTPCETRRVSTRIPVALRRLETTLTSTSLQPEGTGAAIKTRAACKSHNLRREATTTETDAKSQLDPREVSAAIATHSQPSAATEAVVIPESSLWQ